MKKFLLFGFIFTLFISSSYSQTIKILFDCTKAETAGSADWVVDADSANMQWNPKGNTFGSGYHSNPQRFPTPAQSGITASTVESYWKGSLSNWGVDCAKQGYIVETLPFRGSITYGNSNNPQDLSNYAAFVVDEPNIKFSASEQTALINYVKNGGGLFMISDHTVSDRNNDGWDSPAIWNDFMTNNGVKTNPFGISFSLQKFNVISTTVANLPSTDSLLHGAMGSVSKIQWNAGTVMNLDKTANPTATAVFYRTGSNVSGDTGVMVAYARYGKGKVVAFGDSSPFDDGTGNTNSNITLYNSYTGSAVVGNVYNHQRLIMNATIWLVSNAQTLPLTFVKINSSYRNNENLISWQIDGSSIALFSFSVESSADGSHFTTVENRILPNNNNNYEWSDLLSYNNNPIYYRVVAHQKNGNIVYSNVVVADQNQSSDKDFSIYPNPVKDKLTIQFSASLHPTKLHLIDETGKILIEKEITFGSSQFVLPVNRLTAGYYFIELIDKNHKYSKKALIKE